MKALYPGTFNPFHNGHLDIVNRASKLFDEVVVLFCKNPQKRKVNEYAIELNMNLAKSVVKDNVRVETFDGSIAEYCKNNNVDVIVKGLRNGMDLVYEQSQAFCNKTFGNIETLFLTTNPLISNVSSTMVRDLAKAFPNNSEYFLKFMPNDKIEPENDKWETYCEQLFEIYKEGGDLV